MHPGERYHGAQLTDKLLLQVGVAFGEKLADRFTLHQESSIDKVLGCAGSIIATLIWQRSVIALQNS